jgi:hypothetical protein
VFSGLFEFLFGGSELIDSFVLLVSVQLGAMRFLLKDGFFGTVIIERDVDSFEVLVFE